jgi:hypothetical protein
MITPDVERLAKLAREAGTHGAVFEFLCRTRPHFSLSQFVAECVKLDVRRPSFETVLAVVKEQHKLGTLDRYTVRSKVAGEVPE